MVSRAQAGLLGFRLVYSAARLFSLSCLFLKYTPVERTMDSCTVQKCRPWLGKVGFRARQALAAKGEAPPGQSK